MKKQNYSHTPNIFETEINICNDTVYEDDDSEIKRLWKIKANSIYKDEETGLIKISFGDKKIKVMLM